MPLTFNPFRIRRFPMWMLVLLPAGALLAGVSLADLTGTKPNTVTLTKHGTRYVTDVRTVKRVVSGRVVTLQGGERVVHVPLLIVHTDHKTIRVPAHNLPIHHKGGDLQAAIVATPLVPVTVTIYVPSDPIFVPTTVTSTATDTEFVPTTITVTLPLDTTSPPPGND